MFKKTIAKIIRVVTIPPLLVTALILSMYFLKPEFCDVWEAFFGILFLAVIPTLAYPLAAVIPKFKDDKRKGQRTLAFVTSAAGYTGGLIYAFIADVSFGMKIIFLTYFISVVTLVIFNKVFHQRASGHSCGVLGPLMLAVYFLGWAWMIPCAAIAFLVMWSSLYLTRHTPRDLVLGGLSAVFAFALCVLI